MASDDISKIKCQLRDGTASMATWDQNATGLVTGLGDVIASMVPATRAGDWDGWFFNPQFVSFTDLKKELMREWGYTQVYFDGTDSPDRANVSANWDVPSKKKN